RSSPSRRRRSPRPRRHERERGTASICIAFVTNEVQPRTSPHRPASDMALRGGIATRLALLTSLVALVATGTVGYMVYRGAEDALMNAAADRVGHASDAIRLRTWGTLDAIGFDVRFLARSPQARGVVRARLEGGFEIGRASCRERVSISGVDGALRR